MNHRLGRLAVPSTAIPDHGGDLAAAMARFPDAPRPWYDLSTGINPWPYPVPRLPSDCWTRLPDSAATACLRSSAADYYGVPDGEGIVAAPGSQALIQVLPRLRPPSRVAVMGPTYAEHALCWRAAGHAVIEVEDVAALDAADLDVVVVVNPNNPDGRRLAPVDLCRLAEALAARRGWLVVDEAFADTSPEQSVAGAADTPGLIVLRSFGKFFGLAGMRLGFALTSAPVANRLREALGPWAVSGPACTLAPLALSDGSWIAATRTRLAAAAEDLDHLLSVHRLEVIGGTSLFRLVRSERAAQIHATLAQAGLLVRRFNRHPHWLRFGLPPDVLAQTRLERVLARLP